MRIAFTVVCLTSFFAVPCSGVLMTDVTLNQAYLEGASGEINEKSKVFGMEQAAGDGFSSTISTSGPQTNQSNITFNGFGAMSADGSGIGETIFSLAFQIRDLPCEFEVSGFAEVLDHGSFDPIVGARAFDTLTLVVGSAGVGTALSSAPTGTIISTPTQTIGAGQNLNLNFSAQIGFQSGEVPGPESYDYQIAYTLTLTPTADLTDDLDNDGFADGCDCFATAVPEPSAFLCLAIIGLVGTVRRRYVGLA